MDVEENDPHKIIDAFRSSVELLESNPPSQNPGERLAELRTAYRKVMTYVTGRHLKSL